MEESISETNSNDPVDENYSFLDMEIEALQSIFINEIEVSTDEATTNLSIDLHPSTADKLEEQYVRMTLQFILDEKYPDLIPVIKIRNPRGLSDEKLNCIIKDLTTIAENRKGSSMLFEMIEAAKDHLTSDNRPSGECAICLYGFSENDVFTKTECYHYFHSHCLARYSKNFKVNSEDYETDPKSKAVSNELLCPMCRIPIHFDGSEEEYPPPDASGESDFVPSEELVEIQKKMAELYLKQIEKGGIIDVEAEKNKYLLEISNVPTRVNTEEKAEQKTVSEKSNEAARENVNNMPDLASSPNQERKMQNRNRKFDYSDRYKNSVRQDDTRRRYRYNQGNNRQNYSNYGNYNNDYRRKYGDRFTKNERYGQQSSEKDDEESELPLSSRETSVVSSDLECTDKKDDLHDENQDDDRSEVYVHKSDRRKFNYPNKFSDSRPRYNKRYNQGNYYGNRFSRNDRGSKFSSYKESPDFESDEKKGINTDSVRDDKSETSEQQLSEGQRNNYHNKYSDSRPKYNRGYHQSNYGNYNQNGRQRSGSSNYQESSNMQRQRNYDYKNVRGGYNVRRPNYRSNYKHDDYYSRDTEQNSYRENRGGYNRKENNYQGRNDYYKNKRSGREQYNSDRGRNFKDNRTSRDVRHRDDSYNRSRSRNYSENKPEKCSNQPENIEEYCESTNLSRTQSSDSNIYSAENEDIASGSASYKNMPQNDESSLKTDNPQFSDQELNSSPDKSSSIVENNLSFPQSDVNMQGTSQTTLKPPPGFANPLKKVIYGLEGAKPPPGFQRS